MKLFTDLSFLYPFCLCSPLTPILDWVEGKTSQDEKTLAELEEFIEAFQIEYRGHGGGDLYTGEICQLSEWCM